jgi:hypothetical protein
MPNNTLTKESILVCQVAIQNNEWDEDSKDAADATLVQLTAMWEESAIEEVKPKTKPKLSIRKEFPATGAIAGPPKAKVNSEIDEIVSVGVEAAKARRPMAPNIKAKESELPPEEEYRDPAKDVEAVLEPGEHISTPQEIAEAKKQNAAKFNQQ